MGDALGRPRALDAVRRIAWLSVTGRRHTDSVRARGEPGADGQRPSSVARHPARAAVTGRSDGAAVSRRVAIRSCGAVVAGRELAPARLADRGKWGAHRLAVRRRSASEALALRGRNARLSGHALGLLRDARSPVGADLTNLSARAPRAADAGAADRIGRIGACADPAGAVSTPQAGGFGGCSSRGPAHGRRRAIRWELAIRDAVFIERDVPIGRGELALQRRSGDALIRARPGIVFREASLRVAARLRCPIRTCALVTRIGCACLEGPEREAPVAAAAFPSANRHGQPDQAKAKRMAWSARRGGAHLMAAFGHTTRIL
jgi:hypothetical protein